MEFAVELLSKLLVRRKIAVSSPGLALTAQDLLESASYQPCAGSVVYYRMIPSPT